MALADRVVLMNRGRIEQVGAPQDLDDAPATPFVFEFLGECNRLPCTASDGVARFESFAAPVIGGVEGPAVGEALFRPADTCLDAGLTSAGLPVRIAHIGGRGAIRTLECQALSGHRFTAELPEHLAVRFETGQRVRLTARRVMFEPRRVAASGLAADRSPELSKAV